MKYLKKFQTNADYQAFKNSSDWITPNISVIKENTSGNDFIVVFEPFVNTTTRGSYTVNLNGQWEATSAIPNPDSTLYDGVYRSSSNYNVNNGVSTMYIDISGYSEFTLYIRSYAESSFDYVMVSQLDQTITGSTSYSNTTLVKAHTRGIQKSGTTISDYTEVKYTNIDGGSHRITILYRKDSSSHSGDDRGYVLILKNNESSSGGGNNEVTAPLITFTVDGISCQAESGMYWCEWLDSEYNTINATIAYCDHGAISVNGKELKGPGGGCVRCYYDENSGEAIIEGGAYYTGSWCSPPL